MGELAFDVVVVGGGPAGLSAALVLGRARRRVAVVDAGSPRNAPAAHMHGFLTRDGMPHGHLLAAGRLEVAGYGVVLVDDHVLGIQPELLVGILGMYLRQVEETGVLGLVGVVLYGCGFFIIFGFSFVGAAVLPELAETDPRYVTDVMAIVAGADIAGDIGGLAVANVASAVTYLFGGVLFGVALWRARVPWRLASGLLALGALSTILIQVLPESLDRFVAIPVGVAWAGLGLSLWQSTSARRESARGANGEMLGVRSN